MRRSIFGRRFDAMSKQVGICLVIGVLSIIPVSAQAQVKGPNVKQVTFGSAGVTQGMFVQVGDRSWNRLNPDGSVVSSLSETGRDEWSVYLTDSSGASVILNLWTKDVTSRSGASTTALGKVLLAEAEPPTAAPASTPAAATGEISWQTVDGSLKQVSADETTVWGVNAGGQIWRRPVDGSGQWENVCCSLAQVSASGKGWVWGVQANDSIWKCAKPCAANGSGWQQVDGALRQVSGGDSHVWGVNAGGLIWRRPIDGSGAWEQVAGGLKHVSASGNGWIWGVNEGNSIYKCKKPCPADGSGWQQVAGNLTQVDANDAFVMGVYPDGSIYRMPVDGSGSWQKVAGTSFKNMAASGNSWLWGVNTGDGIFKSVGSAAPAGALSNQRSATLSALLPQGQATPPPEDDSAGGTDPVAAAASAAAVGLGLAKSKALGQATVTQGPLLEGQSAADLGNVKESPNSTLKNMCSILSIASSGIKGQVDKAETRKAQEKVMDQWVNILYDAQTQSGVSIESVEPEALINTMALIQTDIEKEMPEAAEASDDSIPTGYSVNDPNGTLQPGAKQIPIAGPARFMVVNKTITFDGVPGSYKLTSSYEGTSGTLNITPGLSRVPAHNTTISTEPEWTSFDIARQTLELAGIADPTGVVAVAAAYLHPVCNTEDAERSRGDYCYRHSDTRGVGIIPIACNPALPDHQAGLCYKPCAEGYHGVGPVCWTNEEVSIPRGVGVVPSGCPASHPVFEAGLCYQACDPGWKAVGTICYQQCPDGYRDDGLYCGKTTYGRGAGYVIWDKAKCERDPLATTGCEQKGALWYPKCKPGFEMTTVNFCQTKGCPAGWQDIGVSCKMPSKGRGVGVVRNVCDASVPDLDAGLCYKNCPEGYNGVGPVCWTKKSVSQPRGAGLVPDQCPPGHPEFDAGLCYQTCPNPEYAGIGPVCWGSCGGRYAEPCGVGCATSKISCGIVTTEMVVAPLEAVASILSLGGYSLVDKVKDSAKKGLKEAVDAADGPAAKAFGQTIGQQAAVALKKNLDKLDNLSKGLTKRKDAIVKAIKDNTLEPVKDRASKAWVKGAQSRLDNKATKLAKDFEKELIQSGAQPDALDKAIFEKVAKSQVEAEVAEKAALKALKDGSPRMLERIEIRDKILRKLSESWNNTDKAWLAVGQKCAGLGFQVAEDWGAVQ